MSTSETARPGLIQVKLRPDVKEWIQEEARAEERAQGWVAAKMLEDAVAREKAAEKGGAQ